MLPYKCTHGIIPANWIHQWLFFTSQRGGGTADWHSWSFLVPRTRLRCCIQDKPPVFSLQNLIVRDIANHERGMFLITDTCPPEMYEFHAASKEDKNIWMRHIQQTVSKWANTDKHLLWFLTVLIRCVSHELGDRGEFTRWILISNLILISHFLYFFIQRELQIICSQLQGGMTSAILQVLNASSMRTRLDNSIIKPFSKTKTKNKKI